MVRRSLILLVIKIFARIVFIKFAMRSACIKRIFFIRGGCLFCPLSQKRDNLRVQFVFVHLNYSFTMEMRGLEPLTSCMPCKRSSQMSYTPAIKIADILMIIHIASNSQGANAVFKDTPGLAPPGYYRACATGILSRLHHRETIALR